MPPRDLIPFVAVQSMWSRAEYVSLVEMEEEAEAKMKMEEENELVPFSCSLFSFY